MKIYICEDDVKQRENMVEIINNYIMIEENQWKLLLVTDNPYEILKCQRKMRMLVVIFRYSIRS